MSSSRSFDERARRARKLRDYGLNVLLVGLVALLLWWAGGGMAAGTGFAWLPEALNGYEIHVLKLVAVYSILALSLNLIYGFTGMFSLGHAGFMAIGAYMSALCVLSPEAKDIMWLIDPIVWPFSVLHTPFWVSVLAGGAVAALVALLIGIPVLRLGGDYLGIATLGLAEIIRVLIVNLTPITNGALGIKGIPRHVGLFTSYAWLLVVLIVVVRFLNSNFGNVLKAVRDDEIAAKVMGVNVFRTKLFSFCMGAFIAGMGGALLGNLLTTIDPKVFTFQLTFNILMIVVAGGLGSVTGSIIGSVIITVMLEWLRFVEESVDLGFMVIPATPGLRMVVFSMLLLIIILFRREGIMGMRELTWSGVFAFFGKLRRRPRSGGGPGTSPGQAEERA